MEGRDLATSSLSSSPAAVNRDGSSTVDLDDGVFSAAVALAKDAALHFQSGKFVECVEVLNQLLEKKKDDPKVLHNITLAEYFRDGCTDPKKLLEVLNTVKKKSDELARASGEQVEAVSNFGNKINLGSKGNNPSVHQFSATNSAGVINADEFDSSVALLNIAIIWFNLHEFAKTLSVLERLYQNIEPIDETIALEICLLLLDAGLACQDGSKSADVLTYLDKAFGVSCMNQGDNGMQQQSSNLIPKSLVPNNSSATDASHTDVTASGNSSENSLSINLSEEPLDDDMTLLDIAGQNLTRTSCLPSSDISRTLVDRTFSSVELKLKLQLYKVRFLLLTRNLRLAKREIKLAMNIARGRDSSMALLLKSHLEYARGNHRKAIKLLMASSNPTDMAFSSIFYNNLGCIYYQIGKFQTSSVLFSKALTICSSLRKEKPQKLSTFSQDNSLLIFYNCGVQYLACGKPLLAARCFQKASLVFYKRPLLWLRLAECCLMALEKGLIKSGHVRSERLEVRVHVVGKGKWRQLVMEDGMPRNGHASYFERDDSLSIDVREQLSLPHARRYLSNVLHLLNSSDSNCSKSSLPSNSHLENDSTEVSSSRDSNFENTHIVDSKAFPVGVGLGQVNSNGDTKEQKGGTTQEFIQNSLSCYEDICRRENEMIMQAALANLAYVELELEDPVKALSAAKLLLEIPECSRVYAFLGHVYAAESLCLLNRLTEAAQHLSIYLSGGKTVELPFSQEDCEKWRVERTTEFDEFNGVTGKSSSSDDSQNIVFLKPEEARGTLYADLAMMCAMQGELEQAHQFATQALYLLPNSTQVTLIAVYVDLMLGKSQEALAKLKRCSRIRFIPTGLTLNTSS